MIPPQTLRVLLVPRPLRLQSPLVSCTDNGRFLALIKDISGVQGKRLMSTVCPQGVTFVVDMRHRMQ
jgi:hypothetical protein